MRVIVDASPAGEPEATGTGFRVPLLIRGEAGSSPDVVVVYASEPIPGFDPSKIGTFRAMVLDFREMSGKGGSFNSWRWIRYADVPAANGRAPEPAKP